MINPTRPAESECGSELVIVAHPDDELLEFSSILFSREGVRPWLIVCTGGTSDRCGHLKHLSDSSLLPKVVIGSQSSNFDVPLDPSALERLFSDNSPPNLQRVWTHNPADDHHHHCTVASVVSRCFGEIPIFYAHGVARDEYQFVSDVCNPLSASEIQAKLLALNTYYADQLKYHTRWLSPGFDTRSVKSTEEFVQLSHEDVRCLYALRHSLDDSAASDEDPWRFTTSAYELDRINATARWIRAWIEPDVDSVVEVGACEGALTKTLLRLGLSIKAAVEPNQTFRDRLTNVLENSSIRIIGCGLGDLAKSRELPATCYLLCEMLYYIGDELGILDNLPTDVLMLAADDDFLTNTVGPWLRAGSQWRIVDDTLLVQPRLEFCVAEKVYRRKQGSRGLVLYRGALRR